MALLDWYTTEFKQVTGVSVIVGARPYSEGGVAIPPESGWYGLEEYLPPHDNPGIAWVRRYQGTENGKEVLKLDLNAPIGWDPQFAANLAALSFVEKSQDRLISTAAITPALRYWRVAADPAMPDKLTRVEMIRTASPTKTITLKIQLTGTGGTPYDGKLVGAYWCWPD
jgi:hypothetical protein